MTSVSTVNGSAACEGLDRKCSWRGVHMASVAASGLSGSCLKPAPSGQQVNWLCPGCDGLVGSAPLSSASAPAPTLAPAPAWWPNPSWRPRCLQHPHSRLSLAAPGHKNGQSWGALHRCPHLCPQPRESETPGAKSFTGCEGWEQSKFRRGLSVQVGVSAQRVWAWPSSWAPCCWQRGWVGFSV